MLNSSKLLLPLKNYGKVFYVWSDTDLTFPLERNWKGIQSSSFFCLASWILFYYPVIFTIEWNAFPSTVPRHPDESLANSDFGDKISKFVSHCRRWVFMERISHASQHSVSNNYLVWMICILRYLAKYSLKLILKRMEEFWSSWLHIIFMTEEGSVNFDCCPLPDLSQFKPVAPITEFWLGPNSDWQWSIQTETDLVMIFLIKADPILTRTDPILTLDWI